MTKRKTKTVGSGITQREQLAPFTEQPDRTIALLEALLESIRADQRDWATKQHIIDEARTELSAIESELQELGIDGSKREAHFKEWESRGWFLQSIVAASQKVEEALETGKTWKAVDEAIEIGILHTELRMKERWERLALKGKRHKDTSDETAENRRLQPAAERYELVLDYRQRGHSWENCYRLAAKKFGVSASMIKKDCLAERKLDNTID